MKASTGVFGEAYASCLSCLAHCCAPFTFRLDQKPHHYDKNHLFPVVSDQPAAQPRPMAVPETELRQLSWKRKVHRSFTSSRTSFSVRSKLRLDASSLRPRISAPFEFRHLESGSFHFPSPGQPPPRSCETPEAPSASFKPLELSFFIPDSETSPISPLFNFSTAVSSPLPAYLPDRPQDGYPLPHQRGPSPTSFHIPRRQIPESSPLIIQEETPPHIPAKSPGRARAYTTSQIDSVKERVANAMNEAEELQKKIDGIIEQQSFYSISRPSTSHSLLRTMPKQEKMPVIPALPPAAPSFAERLHAEAERPQTAPIKASIHINRPGVSDEMPTSDERHSRVTRENRSLPPPLPLVLRPPLRKKKSFSCVSTWLFPEHNRDLSIDSVTNFPLPVKGKEGFYQCVSPGEMSGRRSIESFDTISTWDTDDGDRTAPSGWSPESTPVAKQEEPLLERSTTFGKSSNIPGIMNVGIAI